MRRTDRGMDEKTFYSIIKTIVPYLSTAEKCHLIKISNYYIDFTRKNRKNPPVLSPYGRKFTSPFPPTPSPGGLLTDPLPCRIISGPPKGGQFSESLVQAVFIHRLRGQMSESMLTASFIIVSGGLQDAYTYLCRGGVFANAQTGNIVLFSAYLFEGAWDHCLRYLIPVLSFMAGIFAAECIHRRFKHMEKVHWRQLIILAEIAVLFAVGFMPQSLNTVANSLVSFSCAMQLQTFRKVRGHAYASTMCIGNMRSGTEALCAYFHTHEPEALRNALTYFGVIGLFALGAGLGALLTGASAVRGIWVSCALLTVSFLVMFIHEERRA